ncbi:hypothetical protein ABEL12_25545 [Klebsiella pneumoniae]|uniref:hypothetical protein n=1 Tax=Klebsiella pneumoniae complex TaxID=3390273 RepID=UPI000E2C7959|nr:MULTISPECIES: hypothetical protein [Klebsiella]EKM7480840.1 hypothetical protein [Klebsiella pneumoniae]EMB6036409.1 hypothetical protein [Klebsiella pneumoniae]MDW7136106.1 hypothetical protein [Klebsiella pneumoniae]MDW7157804.1 hypothetical protein [Klebsiella pneumoniae]MDW7397797.1 hypothetical protein [Klebsiella pneumoniae]
MKSGLTIREDNYSVVLDALKQLSGTDVLVGIPADKAEREDGAPYNNAELGYLHSTGATITIPEHTTTIYRQVDAHGDLKRNGRFVKASKSNFSTTHTVPAQVVTIPPRPFLDIGIEDSRDKTTAKLKLAAQAALDGNAVLAEKHLESAGQVARDAAKAVIGDGDRLTPLSEKTKARRRSNGQDVKPLYDHGFLLRAINYVVRKK